MGRAGIGRGSAQEHLIRFRGFVLSCAVSLACVGGAALHLWHRLGRPRTGIDDADIMLVYARHLAGGHGFVYNLGGEHVEGSSSPLWTFFAAAVSRLTAKPEPILAIASALAVSLALAVLIQVVASQARDGTLASKARGLLAGATVLLWTLASPQFIGWTSSSLMETGLWCAELVLASAVFLAWLGQSARDAGFPRAMAVLSVAMTLTRPEGIIVAILLLVIAAGVELAMRPKASRRLNQLRPAVIAVVATAAMSTLIRLLYFGAPLPNTFYAKIGGDAVSGLAQGWSYWREFGRAYPAAVVAGLAGVGLALGALFFRLRRVTNESQRSNKAAQAIWIGAALVALQMIPVLLGGDHFEGFRFYQPIWPLFALPFAFAVLWVPDVSRRQRTGVVLACGIAAFSIGLAHAGSESIWRRAGRLPMRREFDIAAKGREVGAALNRIFPSDDLPTIGVITAGGIKITYPGITYDLMGMNWAQMAHAGGERYGDRGHDAFNAAVFWSQPPQILIVSVTNQRAGPSAFSGASFENQALKGLLDDPDFTGQYQFGRVSRSGDSPATAVAGYFRRDFLASLTEHPEISFSPMTRSLPLH